MPLEEFYLDRPGGGRLLCGRSGRARLGGDGRRFLLLPGFWGDWRREAFAILARSLEPSGDVLAANLSGHPGSSGVFSFGLKEADDVAALYSELRRTGSGTVTACGFSLGGWALVKHLARDVGDRAITEHLVLVCVPSRLPWLAPRPWKAGLRVQLMRGGKGWVKPDPLALLTPRELGSDVGRLGGLPTSFVHCKSDWLVHHSHSERLHSGAVGPKRLVVLDDERGLHAEMLALFHLERLLAAVLEIPL